MEPAFHTAVGGASNPYNQEISDKLADRILQQTIASAWKLVIRKP